MIDFYRLNFNRTQAMALDKNIASKKDKTNETTSNQSNEQTSSDLSNVVSSADVVAFFSNNITGRTCNPSRVIDQIIEEALTEEVTEDVVPQTSTEEPEVEEPVVEDLAVDDEIYNEITEPVSDKTNHDTLPAELLEILKNGNIDTLKAKLDEMNIKYAKQVRNGDAYIFFDYNSSHYTFHFSQEDNNITSVEKSSIIDDYRTRTTVFDKDGNVTSYSILDQSENPEDTYQDDVGKVYYYDANDNLLSITELVRRYDKETEQFICGEIYYDANNNLINGNLRYYDRHWNYIKNEDIFPQPPQKPSLVEEGELHIAPPEVETDSHSLIDQYPSDFAEYVMANNFLEDCDFVYENGTMSLKLSEQMLMLFINGNPPEAYRFSTIEHDRFYALRNMAGITKDDSPETAKEKFIKLFEAYGGIIENNMDMNSCLTITGIDIVSFYKKFAEGHYGGYSSGIQETFEHYEFYKLLEDSGISSSDAVDLYNNLFIYTPHRLTSHNNSFVYTEQVIETLLSGDKTSSTYANALMYAQAAGITDKELEDGNLKLIEQKIGALFEKLCPNDTYAYFGIDAFILVNYLLQNGFADQILENYRKFMQKA